MITKYLEKTIEPIMWSYKAETLYKLGRRKRLTRLTEYKRKVNVSSMLEPLRMSPVDRLARLPGPISPWVHIRNFSPVSERNRRPKILGTISGTKFEKQSQNGGTQKLTFAPIIIALATLKAVSLQLNGCL